MAMASTATKPVQFAETVTVTGTDCPACGRKGGRVFYEVDDIPVHQVRLVRTREDALNCATGDMRLCFCGGCGFVWNAAFDPGLVGYEDDYESTQTVSPTFNRFHERLGRQLVERFDLVGKRVIEVGCGQGEFLHMLRNLGVAEAIGFDPVLRNIAEAPGIRTVKDWYSEAYADLEPDFVGTKMTMEHIPDPRRFIRMLRKTVGDRPVVVFSMVPEITRILDLNAFWDIYYEHCTYFCRGSFARAFRDAGFHVVDVWRDFGEQYVLIGAQPGDGPQEPLPAEESVEAIQAKVDRFVGRVAEDRRRWRDWLDDQRCQGRKVVLWGGGSKGVAFLTTLGITDGVDYAVDLNPRRDGTFIAGTGQEIKSPSFLAEYRPDAVVIMSPIYTDEISADLASMGIAPEIVSVEEGPGARQAA